MSKTAYRAILSHTQANKSKLDKVAMILPIWREGLKIALKEQEARIKSGERISWIDTKSLRVNGEVQPSQRYWKNIVNQVNNDLKSWRARVSEAAKPLIFQLDLSETSTTERSQTLKKLFTLNKAGLWYQDERLVPILEDLLVKYPLPCYEHTRTMLMDGLIAEFQQARNKNSVFKKWLRVSLPGGKPVLLPLRFNPYLEAHPGTEQLCQFIVNDDNSVSLRVVKKFGVDPQPIVSSKVVGLDWGLKSLLTTSDGEQFGRRLYGWLLERDAELTELTRSLQANNVPLKSSKRYRKLNKRVRDYVTNEVGRIVNLLSAEEISTLVVEDLDFRGSGLSKRLNRVIARAGRRVLVQRLNDLSEETGVEVVRVSAAYSSQECNSCGFVSKRNRPSQPVFHCKFCGLRLNADVNSSRTVRDRRSNPSLTGSIHRKTVLELLDQKFYSTWGITFDQYSERSTPRPRSRARGPAPLN